MASFTQCPILFTLMLLPAITHAAVVEVDSKGVGVLEANEKLVRKKGEEDTPALTEVERPDDDDDDDDNHGDKHKPVIGSESNTIALVRQHNPTTSANSVEVPGDSATIMQLSVSSDGSTVVRKKFVRSSNADVGKSEMPDTRSDDDDDDTDGMMRNTMQVEEEDKAAAKGEEKRDEHSEGINVDEHEEDIIKEKRTKIHKPLAVLQVDADGLSHTITQLSASTGRKGTDANDIEAEAVKAQDEAEGKEGRSKKQRTGKGLGRIGKAFSKKGFNTRHKGFMNIHDNLALGKIPPSWLRRRQPEDKRNSCKWKEHGCRSKVGLGWYNCCAEYGCRRRVKSKHNPTARDSAWCADQKDANRRRWWQDRRRVKCSAAREQIQCRCPGDTEQQVGPLAVGDAVELQNLNPASALNGKTGVITAIDGGITKVKMDGGSVRNVPSVKVKAANATEMTKCDSKDRSNQILDQHRKGIKTSANMAGGLR